MAKKQTPRRNLASKAAGSSKTQQGRQHPKPTTPRTKAGTKPKSAPKAATKRGPSGTKRAVVSKRRVPMAAKSDAANGDVAGATLSKGSLGAVSRDADMSLSPEKAKAAAWARIRLAKDDPFAKWFDDPLRAPNEFATVRDCIEGQAKRYGAKPFLFYEEDGRVWSYADLDHETSVNVNMFRALGASPGARIGILDANTPEMVGLYLGCMKGGYTSAPLNYHLKAPELVYCLENSESELLFVAAEFWPELSKALPELGFLKAIVVMGTVDGGLPGSVAGGPKIVSWDHARKGIAAGIPRSHPRPSPDTDAEIIYTSGTTGKAKGVLLRHHQFLTDAKYISRWFRMTPDTRMMMVLPLFHVNAEVVTTCTPLVAGGSVVMFRKFSAKRFWRAVEKHRVNIVSVVPTILTVLVSQECEVMGERAMELGGFCHPRPFGDVGLREKGAAAAHDVSSLWTIICGAAPLPAEVQMAFERTFLIPVTEGYGLSETTCYSTFNPVDGQRKIATIGVEVGNQVTMLTPEGKALGPGATGEICIRGENVMREYFKRDEANVEAFAGGWFHSGDVGDVDCDGFVRIRDRIKDMIIRGGENIYPREIDEVLYSHPLIENAATIGIPDPKYGEEVASFVVLKDGRVSAGAVGAAGDVRVMDAVTAAEIEKDVIAFCKARLANYKVPRSVTFVHEIPKGPTGKLLRRELRRMAGGGKG